MNDIIINTGINYHRLMHNEESKKIIIDIWKQIHNNIVFTYNGDYDIREFKIINKFELLYVRNNSELNSESYIDYSNEQFIKSIVQNNISALQCVRNEYDSDSESDSDSDSK
jgi:uncharacterized membrane protein affecting hemolysin expression